MDNNDLIKTRLEYIYKILYPLLVLLWTFFVCVSTQPSLKDNNSVMIFCISIISFLGVLIINMIIYIFEELRWLKNKDKTLILKQKLENGRKKAEERYENIFICFTVSGWTSMSMLSIGLLFPNFILQKWDIMYILGTSMTSIMLGSLPTEKHVCIKKIEQPLFESNDTEQILIKSSDIVSANVKWISYVGWEIATFILLVNTFVFGGSYV